MLLIGIKNIFRKDQSNLSNATRTSLPEQIVAQIQAGNVGLRNAFIAEHQPYIAKIASQFYKRHIHPASDDEFTIALAAFDEAINQYHSQMERKFLDFAVTIMQRRMTEYSKKGNEESTTFVDSFHYSDQFEKQSFLEERKSEISDLGEVLQEFDMDFGDLIEQSPRDEELNSDLISVSKQLSEDAEMMRLLLKTRKLPVKELASITGVSRKILNRHEQYITTLTIINNGPFPNLRTYLNLASPREKRGKL